ncbi:hypothetical protein Ancab_025312 [Ancistrocladus abbreviatus]
MEEASAMADQWMEVQKSNTGPEADVLLVGKDDSIAKSDREASADGTEGRSCEIESMEYGSYINSWVPAVKQGLGFGEVNLVVGQTDLMTKNTKQIAIVKTHNKGGLPNFKNGDSETMDQSPPPFPKSCSGPHNIETYNVESEFCSHEESDTNHKNGRTRKGAHSLSAPHKENSRRRSTKKKGLDDILNQYSCLVKGGFGKRSKKRIRKVSGKKVLKYHAPEEVLSEGATINDS